MTRVLNTDSTLYLDRLIAQGPIEKYLQRLKEHHDDSYEHSHRVALLAIDLGYENRLSDTEIRTLGYAGLLHDFGKTSIDAALLSKPAKLSPEERAAVRYHPRLGYLQLEEDLFRKVKMVVAGHHEFQTKPFPRSNGDRRGAPREASSERRIEDESIDRLTQIIAISDMFDALASARSYKDGLSQEKIHDILRDQFTGDPMLIDQVLARYPE